jgi:uroporphyrinogen-III synthase
MLVVLLREEEEGDEYSSLLSAAGHACAFLPALCCELQSSGLQQLCSELSSASLPAGLLVTSRRAAAALTAAAEQLPQEACRARLRCLPVLAVGSRTAAALQPCFDTILGGQAAGSAAALLPLALELWRQAAAREQAQAQAQHLLFVCGDKRLGTLPDGLAAAGVPCRELPVYCSRPVEPAVMGSCWQQLLLQRAAGSAEPGPPAAAVALVLFSPSGVQAAIAAGILPASSSSPPSLRLVAIGPTTAAACSASGLSCAAVAGAPSAAGVAAAVAELC